MSISYYIDNLNKLWIKDDIAPNGYNIYYIKKISGYTPNEDNIFEFVDNFNDTSINTTKWFTDGTGVITETGSYAYVKSVGTNTYPRFVTVDSIDLTNRILEYDVKVISFAVDSCRIGYTSYYLDGNTLALWYLYVDVNGYVNLWTRINGVWALRWKSTYQIIEGSWYKFRFINTDSTLKFQLLRTNETLITQSDEFSYDKTYVQNFIYFGQRSAGDEGYFDNFTIRKYITTEPTVTVKTEGQDYKIVVKNNLNEELHDYQVYIPTESLGTITSTTSLFISNLYRTPLTQPYNKLYTNCKMNIIRMLEDTTNNHNISIYNKTNSNGRFNDYVNSVYFNGVNTRGVIYNTEDLNLFNTDNFTLSFWIKQTGDYTNSWCNLISKSANITNTINRWRLIINQNNVCFIIQDDSIGLDCTNLQNPIKINDSNWHMITFVRSGSYLYTYKDASLMQTISLNSITNFANTTNVDIGATVTSVAYDKFFNGYFGEIVLYNTSLSAKSILKRYNLSQKKYIKFITNTYLY